MSKLSSKFYQAPVDQSGKEIKVFYLLKLIECFQDFLICIFDWFW